MNIKVHLLGNYDTEFVNELKSKLDSGITITAGEDTSENADFHMLVAGVPKRKHLLASPNLHTLIIPWSGLPTKTRELLMEFPQISVHNIHHNAAPAAETAMALLLAAAKKIVKVDKIFRTNDWTPRYEENDLQLLEGKTALILGYGAIGRRIAGLCRAFGIKVKATRNSISEYVQKNDIELYPNTELHDLLPNANVLFVTLPLSTETTSLLSARELSLLPDNAIVVNIARGPVIDQKALYKELKAGRIFAGTDVWYNYPQKEIERKSTPPADYPFGDLDNVVMIPHMAGHSDRTEALRIEKLAELLNSALSGGIIPNKINLERGY